MLPRHTRAALSSVARQNVTHSKIAPRPLRLASNFHSSSARRDELPKSPFQTFVEVLKDEIKKNRQLQDNVKTVSGEVDKLQDSEALKRTKELYERARVCNASTGRHIC